MSYFYIIILIVFVTVFFLEAIFLKRTLKKIPIRILVNGTRGKSTTVRLLYESFRLNEKTVYAKTTGDSPEVLYPDGTVKILKRFSPPSIIENLRILSRATRQQPDVFIMECMALQPEIQRFLASHIFRPHYTVITNIIPDHAEVMGTDLVSVAQTIGQCIESETTLFLKKDDLELFRQAEIKLPGYRLLSDLAPPVSCKNIPVPVLKESWSILQSVNEEFGINETLSNDIFKNIWQEADSKICLSLTGHKTKIFNLFSVNDVHSTDTFLSFLSNGREQIFIVNCRKDRPLRTKSFIELLTNKYSDVPLWLTGNGAPLARRLLARQKNPDNRSSIYSFDQIIKKIHTGFSDDTSIHCLGNHKGVDDFIEKLNNLHNSTIKRVV